MNDRKDEGNREMEGINLLVAEVKLCLAPKDRLPLSALSIQHIIRII